MFIRLRLICSSAGRLTHRVVFVVKHKAICQLLPRPTILNYRQWSAGSWFLVTEALH